MTVDQFLKRDVLEPDEAVAFLAQRVRGESATLISDEAIAATELVRELGYFALALEQAGAFLVQIGGSFRNYLDLYRKCSVGQTEKARSGTEWYETIVATTSQISFDAVKQECPAATELLTLSAYLTPDNIPTEVILAAAQETLPALQAFFEKATDPDEKQELSDAVLEPLSRYSLVTVDRTARTYSVHHFMQSAIRYWHKEEEQNQWKHRAIQVIDVAFPNFVFENSPQCERLLSCALVVAAYSRMPECRNKTTGLLLSKTACYLQTCGRSAEAESMLVETLAICREVLPSRHHYIATSLSNLGVLYQYQHRQSEAEPMLVEALAIRREVLPSKHPDTALSLTSMAQIYQSQNRLGEAELMLVEALAIRREVFPPKHPDVARSLDRLGNLYRFQNRSHEAEALLVEALAIRREVLPSKHPYVAASLNSLAMLYVAQNRLDEAELMYMEALTIRREVLTPRHADIANSLNNLALLYRSRNRFDEAEPMLVEALAIRREVLPSKHPDIANSLNNLALLYAHQDRRTEAEPIYREALAILKDGLGNDHPHTKLVSNNLTNFLLEQLWVEKRYS